MKNKFLIATGNQNKIAEIKDTLNKFSIDPTIILPAEVGLEQLDPIENSDTLKGNAKIKATEFFNASKINSLADDTGLEVDFLDGAPGVRSARFAGEDANSEMNRKLLLEKLNNAINRTARFKTVFCFKTSEKSYFFEGICEGKIAISEKGDGGFGYDPVFIPNGFDKTFAELDSSIKNEISHRALAVKSFAKWYSNYQNI